MGRPSQAKEPDVNRAVIASLLLTAGFAATGCPAAQMVLVSTGASPGAPSPTTAPSSSALPAMPTPGPVPSGTVLASPGVVRVAAKDALPWPAPADTVARIRQAGLQEASTEAFTLHIHSHLTVYVNGQFVVVPALIGIDPGGAFISPLHTHASDGIVHIESPRKTDFHLTQVLTEWGVSPDGFTAYINGVKQADVASVLLADKTEIALIYGPVPDALPKAYPATGP
jgi:hypothetical protein